MSLSSRGKIVVVWGYGRRFSPGRKTQGQGYRPSTGLRPLIVLRIKCGGADLVEATQRVHMHLIYVGYGIKYLLEYVCWKFALYDVS